MLRDSSEPIECHVQALASEADGKKLRQSLIPSKEACSLSENKKIRLVGKPILLAAFNSVLSSGGSTRIALHSVF